jgi:hypothetical protein
VIIYFKQEVLPGTTVDITHIVRRKCVLQEVLTRIYPGSNLLLDLELFIARASDLHEDIVTMATGSSAYIDGENDTFEDDRLGIRLLDHDVLHVRATNNDPMATLPVAVRMRLEE